MSEKLLPCPFCGGEAKFFSAYLAGGGGWVECGGCGMQTALVSVEGEAVDLWNRRVQSPVAQAELAVVDEQCPSCAEHERKLREMLDSTPWLTYKGVRVCCNACAALGMARKGE